MKAKILEVLFRIVVFLGLTNLSDSQVGRFVKKLKDKTVVSKVLGYLALVLGVTVINLLLLVFITMFMLFVISNIDPNFYPCHEWAFLMTLIVAMIITAFVTGSIRKSVFSQ